MAEVIRNNGDSSSLRSEAQRLAACVAELIRPKVTTKKGRSRRTFLTEILPPKIGDIILPTQTMHDFSKEIHQICHRLASSLIQCFAIPCSLARLWVLSWMDRMKVCWGLMMSCADELPMHLYASVPHDRTRSTS